MPICIIQQKLSIGKMIQCMNQINNVERVTCSQEELEHLLVKLKSVLDMLVGLSEDPDETFSFNKIYSKQKS